MQRIFWIGSPFFCSSLEECGWQVHYFNFEDVAVFAWQDLVRMAGWEPEVVVVADKSRPPFVLGIEDFPCLTVFYAVDSHIHSWYPHYAQAFDCCLVSLFDHQELFLGKRMHKDLVLWSPPFARNEDQPSPGTPTEWDSLFVGTVSASLTPKRAHFFEELKALVPGLHVTRGNYRQLFPKARVLINHCEGDDLNFRVFEALGCGGCLVTPRVGHGMSELFVDGEHMVTYAQNDAADAAAKIGFLLGDRELTSYIARTGLALVNAKHRALHRAQTFTDFMCDIWMQDVQYIIDERRARAHVIREQWLRMLYLLLAEEIPYPQLQAAYLDAAQGTFAGAKEGF